ncbi:MAG: hypothetical protein HDR37_00480 [Treponema sp.]|nr:hypothetical protein [Treponema sp.]
MKRLASICYCLFLGTVLLHSQQIIKAVEDNNATEVTRLIQAGANVNARDSIGYTALMWAANHYAVDAAKALIEAGADMNAKDNNGYTALMVTVGKGSFDVAKVLIEAGADLNARNNDGETALMLTTYRNNARSAKPFIEAGADVNARNNDGKTVSMCAAMYNAVDVLALLIEAGADINAKDNDGKTALMLAEERGSVDVIGLLKAAGRESANELATERTKSTEPAEMTALPEAAVSKPAPAVGKTATVTENLRLRTDDNMTAEVVTTLSAGTCVKVLAHGREDTIDGIASNWVQVRVLGGAKDKDGNAIEAGTIGWLFGGYVSEAESAESERANKEADAKESSALLILLIAASGAALVILLAAILLAVKKKKSCKE